MKKKRKLIVIAIVLILAISTYLFLRRHDFLYAGTIEATETDIPSRVASVISNYAVEESDQVRSGQIVVRLACEDIAVAADIADKDYERAAKLLKTGSLPKETYEHLKAKRDDSSLKLEWCTIKAPSDGIVLEKYREPGEWVSPGSKLLTIANLKEVWAIIYVEQPFINRLKQGMELDGALPELPGKKFKGRISRINSEAEFTPKNVQTREERTRLVYGVKVTFQNDQLILKPGMTIEVRLPFARGDE